jgi:Zn-dependent protease
VTCTFHADRETLLGCSRCGRSACPECLRDAPVGQHCLACVEGLPADEPLDAAAVRRLTTKQRKQQQASSGSRRPGWVFHAIVVVFVGLCAATQPFMWEIVAGEPIGRAVAIGVVVLGVVLSVTLHEYAHAVTAYWGGDRSVVAKGYLTLDFRRYAHPLLSIGLPVLFLAMGGLPLPGGAVLVEEHRLRSRAWSSLVSLTGGLMNVAFVFVLALLVSSEALWGGNWPLRSILAYLLVIEVALIVLNYLPIPGLDGYGVIEPFLPRALAEPLEALRPWGFFILVGLMFTGSLGFIWDIGFDVAEMLGVDPSMAWLGGEMASLPDGS